MGNSRFAPGDHRDSLWSSAALLCLRLGGVMVRCMSVVILWGAFVSLPASAAMAEEKRTQLEILVPAYFYPGNGEEWNRLTAAAEKVPIIAILNPASGPGRRVDLQFVAAARRLRKAGGKVIAYIATNYGKKKLTDVLEEVRKYTSSYPIDGFFLDEMSNDKSPSNVSYHAGIYKEMRRSNPTFRIIGNPGTNTQETYLTTPTVDGLVVFEINKGYREFRFDGWISRHPASHFAHLLYEIPTAEEFEAYLRLACQRNVGMIYITDDGKDGNPWDRLPRYWDEEVKAIAEWNRQR